MVLRGAPNGCPLEWTAITHPPSQSTVQDVARDVDALRRSSYSCARNGTRASAASESRAEPSPCRWRHEAFRARQRIQFSSQALLLGLGNRPLAGPAPMRSSTDGSSFGGRDPRAGQLLVTRGPARRKTFLVLRLIPLHHHEHLVHPPDPLGPSSAAPYAGPTCLVGSAISTTRTGSPRCHRFQGRPLAHL